MPLKISRSTLICAVEVLEEKITTHADLTRLMLKLGPEVSQKCDEGTIKDRFNNLVKFSDGNRGYICESGKDLPEEICSLVILDTYTKLKILNWNEAQEKSRATGAPFNDMEWTEISDKAKIFLRALDRDGLKIVDGKIEASLPDILDLPEANDDVSRLLKKHGFATSKGHLDQALGSHGRGEWASANGQLRTFYEGLFDEIANKIDPTASALPYSENRRARLASLGFIDSNLNEWGNDGKNFVNGLFKRLHPAGSHPGLSDQDDSTFRLHVVLLTARLFLLRFDKWPR
jgi:hypothetical protein